MITPLLELQCKHNVPILFGAKISNLTPKKALSLAPIFSLAYSNWNLFTLISFPFDDWVVFGGFFLSLMVFFSALLPCETVTCEKSHNRWRNYYAKLFMENANAFIIIIAALGGWLVLIFISLERVEFSLSQCVTAKVAKHLPPQRDGLSII